MANPDRSWGPAFDEDVLDLEVEDQEFLRLMELGLDFPFHIVEAD